MKKEKKKDWIKLCIRCKEYYKATGKTSKICPNCILPNGHKSININKKLK